ncbi:head GIN domain-containing protein [Hufsiella ginkgonis]|uniref:DUF4097 family beta strand repeat protein n=1 Tax=Hufsiella ginkgonis TaxID=2695274 RepID=A0A7K1XYJ9_9SPHI|nr:head GIN domain-containing protein [Hufsiella ginkgonis]MXV16050.1 DUF4097 family beta strand repeat protein [Hufsiella ginkgonis]
MKKIATSLGWLMLLIPFFTMAGTRTIYPVIKHTPSDSETRQVSGFHGIASGGSFNVTVNIGSQESLKIEGDSEVLAKIETVVEKGILVIRTKRGMNWGWNTGKVNVYVTARSLSTLTCSGSGSITVEDRLKSAELNTVVSGSGSIRLSADTKDYNAVISGSGSISIAGSATDASILVSGSGGFRGSDFSTSSTSVKVSGSGSVHVAAEKTLDAKLSGSGSVRYSGNAQVSMVKSGSGSVKKI